MFKFFKKKQPKKIKEEPIKVEQEYKPSSSTLCYLPVVGDIYDCEYGRFVVTKVNSWGTVLLYNNGDNGYILHKHIFSYMQNWKLVSRNKRVKVTVEND